MEFRGGYIVNYDLFDMNDVFMELQPNGHGHIFCINQMPGNLHCIRMLWTCSDVDEKPWVKCRASRANKTNKKDENISFMYMLNLEQTENRRYTFNEEFSRWFRQKANPNQLFRIHTQCTNGETQTGQEDLSPKKRTCPQEIDFDRSHLKKQFKITCM